MAIANLVVVSAISEAGPPAVSPAAAFASPWTIVQSDITSATSGASLDPGAETDTAHFWVQVPRGATRAWFRSRVSNATTNGAAATAMLFGCMSLSGSPAAPEDGEVVVRIDSPSDADAAGFSIPIATNSTTVLSDGLYDYGDIANAGEPFDLMSQRFILLMVTGAGTTDGGGVVIAQFMP